MNFANTLQETVSKTFDFTYKAKGGKEVTEAVTIEFRSECMTPVFTDVLVHFSENKDVLGIAQQLSKALTGWSLVWQEPDDEDPLPFPPSYENLSEKCSLMFLMELVNQISETTSGNAPTQSQSQNGLAVAAKSKTAKASE